MFPLGMPYVLNKALGAPLSEKPLQLSISYLLCASYVAAAFRNLSVRNQGLAAVFSLKSNCSVMFILVGFRSLHASALYLKDAPAIKKPQISASSIFDDILEDRAEIDDSTGERQGAKEFHWSSANFKASPQKLNMLARQIRGLPVQEAINQMQFSNKRVSTKILHNLAFARTNAEKQKGMVPKNTVVEPVEECILTLPYLISAQAWVGKGKYIRRIKIHGRGRFGMVHHPTAHIKFILKEQPDSVPKGMDRNRKTKKVWTPLIESKPIYNPKPYYNW
ncbi:ribosomal protein L22/L17 [Jimgerdemannia flammicorona]|uniref:Ribosomal protein L22/L17 n=1 Tax=Jimgerdemannia flammicorona TaxID=994334 RepID=A0A433DJB7_9FUNG|nr:ribosomal protein L22/L17 [Jimgerdemannia flammicorona]